MTDIHSIVSGELPSQIDFNIEEKPRSFCFIGLIVRMPIVARASHSKIHSNSGFVPI